MPILRSESLNVYHNLALEELALECSGSAPLLLLWRSASAVVIGKNQNPWRECRLDRMQADGVPLARRISGGGAVYHDEGNLNYALVVPRSEYTTDTAFNLVLRALAACGVEAEKTGKSNLSIHGLKFSGNAFCFRKGWALHHGTLLLEADLNRLGYYLGSMPGSFQTRAIASEPAPVTNLHIPLEKIETALQESFLAQYPTAAEPIWHFDSQKPFTIVTSRRSDGLVAYPPRERDETVASTTTSHFQKALKACTQRHASKKWLFETTPRFAVEKDGIRLEVEKGKIIQGTGKGIEALIGTPFSL